MLRWAYKKGYSTELLLVKMTTYYASNPKENLVQNKI